MPVPDGENTYICIFDTVLPAPVITTGYSQDKYAKRFENVSLNQLRGQVRAEAARNRFVGCIHINANGNMLPIDAESDIYA